MAVYLIHFQQPYRHARHYVGWTNDVPRRIHEHRCGMGARLLEVVNAAGIHWDVVKVWPDGDRKLERRLKGYHGSAQFCPVCKEKARLGLVDTPIIDRNAAPVTINIPAA